MRERLKAKPAKVVCENLYLPAIEADSARSFDNMNLLNMAHVLMLEHQHIIGHDSAVHILNGLVTMAEEGPDSIGRDPMREDYYFNVEKRLIDLVGMNDGGKMHTARSRNDLNATIARMNTRDCLLEIGSLVLSLRGELLRLAKDNCETIVTGYTHMQPAQPITFAHYFSAIAEAVERDYDRILSSFERLNLSPLGAGAFAGTSFPIDREYTANRLGFTGILENTLDAVASRDYMLEIAGDFATLGSTLSRFANDLYCWATDEFHYIEVDDSLAVCSSIMPQKKNPITLEHVKSKSSHLAAAYMSIFTCLRGAAYGHARDVAGESPHLFWDAAHEMEVILKLLCATLQTLVIRKDNAARRVNDNFCTVTELADYLVVKQDLSFRVAHQIVGKIVGDCLDAGLTCSQIDGNMVRKAARVFTDQEPDITDEEVKEVLGGEHSVKKRVSAGSPMPENVRLVIGELEEKLRKDRIHMDEVKTGISQAFERLAKDMEVMTGRKQHGIVKEWNTAVSSD